MAREVKEKDEAARSNETSNHVFHNTSHETVNNQDYNSVYTKIWEEERGNSKFPGLYH